VPIATVAARSPVSLVRANVRLSCYNMDMRILITGQRDWECRPLARAIIGRLTRKYGSKIVIVHGDGNGVDQAFQIECREGNIVLEAHPANWEMGKRAGRLRNAEMIATKPDFVIAIHRDLARKGTKDCVKQALAAGLRVYLFDHETRDARRIKADDPRLAWKAQAQTKTPTQASTWWARKAVCERIGRIWRQTRASLPRGGRPTPTRR
jgi:YspA, cpYpsA-related SLOG family